MNGSLETIDGRPALRFERRYEHSVERVWKAITDPDELRHWFPTGAELEIAESEPPRLLSGSWYGDPCGSSCVPTATAVCSSSPTRSPTAKGQPGTLPAGIAASRASRPYSQVSR
jgi:Activator of Hsp90 ATPase homolog 1-like protein